MIQANLNLIKLGFWWFQKSVETEPTLKHPADAARGMCN